jgi:hypothetical protein
MNSAELPTDRRRLLIILLVCELGILKRENVKRLEENLEDFFNSDMKMKDT